MTDLKKNVVCIVCLYISFSTRQLHLYTSNYLGLNSCRFTQNVCEHQLTWWPVVCAYVLLKADVLQTWYYKTHRLFRCSPAAKYSKTRFARTQCLACTSVSLSRSLSFSLHTLFVVVAMETSYHRGVLRQRALGLSSSPGVRGHSLLSDVWTTYKPAWFPWDAFPVHTEINIHTAHVLFLFVYISLSRHQSVFLSWSLSVPVSLCICPGKDFNRAKERHKKKNRSGQY